MIIEKHILDMLNPVAMIKPSIITAVLKDAKIHILNDGVLEGHAMFDLLHKYYSMHLLQMWGFIEDIVSEEVGDIKTEYSKTASSSGESKWFKLYERELEKILSS